MAEIFLQNLFRRLGEGDLIFCCAGPSDPNFVPIKITLISHIHFFLFTNIYLTKVDIDINKNSVYLTTLNDGIKRCDRFHKHKFLDLVDVLTLKLRIIIIILRTNRPKIFLPAACTTNKNLIQTLFVCNLGMVWNRSLGNVSTTSPHVRKIFIYLYIYLPIYLYVIYI